MTARTRVLEAIGVVLRAERQRQGLTQEALAEIAGIHPTHLGGIERGTRNPTATTMSKLLTALGLGWRAFGARVGARLDASSPDSD